MRTPEEIAREVCIKFGQDNKIPDFKSMVSAGMAEAYRDVLGNWPECNRDLCREKWTGEPMHDDCFSCIQRQAIERKAEECGG